MALLSAPKLCVFCRVYEHWGGHPAAHSYREGPYVADGNSARPNSWWRDLQCSVCIRIKFRPAHNWSLCVPPPTPLMQVKCRPTKRGEFLFRDTVNGDLFLFLNRPEKAAGLVVRVGRAHGASSAVAFCRASTSTAVCRVHEQVFMSCRSSVGSRTRKQQFCLFGAQCAVSVVEESPTVSPFGRSHAHSYVSGNAHIVGDWTRSESRCLSKGRRPPRRNRRMAG